jgi:hypothetical protein
MNPADRYEVVMASDVARDGMCLELYDHSPRRLALTAFYSDADGSFTFETHLDGVPAEVDLWFRQHARERLPPLP